MLGDDSYVSPLTNNGRENYSSLKLMTWYCEDQKHAKRNAARPKLLPFSLKVLQYTTLGLEAILFSDTGFVLTELKAT